MQLNINTNTNNTIKNEAILTLINSNAMKTRIKKELKNLYDMFNNIEVNLNENTITISIVELIDGKQHIYGFEISENYPFIPPKIFYQNKTYLKYLINNFTSNNIQLLKKVSGYDCLCCHSYQCRDNWSPAVTIDKIIGEIHSNRKIKRKMINKIMADKIKFKYLIQDIDLDCWLF